MYNMEQQNYEKVNMCAQVREEINCNMTGGGGIAKYDISHVKKFLPEKLLESFNAIAHITKYSKQAKEIWKKKSIAHSAEFVARC